MGVRAKAHVRSGRTVILAAVVISILVFGGVMALASHVDPVFVAGNPTCPEGLTALQADGEGFHNGVYSDDTLTVTISNFNADEKSFDWSSNIGVDQVIVKGGPNANVYTYAPEETADTGLHTPFNENSGSNYGLSHVLFCYDSEGTPTPTPTETETVTPTPTPTETESASPTPTVTPSESPSVLPTETETQVPGPSVSPSTSVLGRVLGRTGADVIRLALFALMLVGLGIGSYVVAHRAGNRNRS